MGNSQNVCGAADMAPTTLLPLSAGCNSDSNKQTVVEVMIIDVQDRVIQSIFGLFLIFSLGLLTVEEANSHGEETVKQPCDPPDRKGSLLPTAVRAGHFGRRRSSPVQPTHGVSSS